MVDRPPTISPASFEEDRLTIWNCFVLCCIRGTAQAIGVQYRQSFNKDDLISGSLKQCNRLTHSKRCPPCTRVKLGINEVNSQKIQENVLCWFPGVLSMESTILKDGQNLATGSCPIFTSKTMADNGERMTRRYSTFLIFLNKIVLIERVLWRYYYWNWLIGPTELMDAADWFKADPLLPYLSKSKCMLSRFHRKQTHQLILYLIFQYCTVYTCLRKHVFTYIWKQSAVAQLVWFLCYDKCSNCALFLDKLNSFKWWHY